MRVHEALLRVSAPLETQAMQAAATAAAPRAIRFIGRLAKIRRKPAPCIRLADAGAPREVA